VVSCCSCRVKKINRSHTHTHRHTEVVCGTCVSLDRCRVKYDKITRVKSSLWTGAADAVRLRDDDGMAHFSIYKILFHFKALLWESIIRLLPPHHLQSLPYCNTIARLLRNIRPPTDAPFVCHTPYNIGDGNIV